MHKFILWMFGRLKDVEKCIRIVCLFFLMMLSLYWIQNLIEADWVWMRFFNPILEEIVNFANSICSISFDFWGKTMEVKYFVALIVVVVTLIILKYIIVLLEHLEYFYDKTHTLCKKANEDLFNKTLYKEIESKEKMISKYMMYIKANISKKHNAQIKNVDIEKHNEELQKFIYKQIGITPIESWDGYLYHLKNFEKVDDLLDILFKIKSTPSIDYIICIQVGEDVQQIRKLASLEYWNKIIISAETLNRYTFNRSQKYKTANAGIFTLEDKTLEVHEFEEDL